MIVYMATNKINNKVYIGQTVMKLHRRKTGHLLAARRGSGAYFHRAIRKYGEDAETLTALNRYADRVKEVLFEKFVIKGEGL